MTVYLDPQSLGLPPRTIVTEIAPDTIVIVINRKSRVVMADGKKIVAKADKIKKTKPGRKVMLKTSAPVCSKTLLFLADNGIEVSE
jgi:hypothetical protein